VAVLALAAVLLLATAVMARSIVKHTREEGRNDLESSGLGRPVVVEEAGRDDPAQLVPPAVLYAEGRTSIFVVTESGAGATAVDQDTLALLLQAVKAVPQEEIEARADRSVRWSDFAHPERRAQLRGRICRFSGTLRRLAENDQVEPSALGVPRLFEGQIQDAEGHFYSFYCFERPAREISRSDLATVTGVFYKLIAFTTRKGTRKVTPLLVARTVTSRKLLAPKTLTERLVEGTPPWALYAGLGALVIAIFGVLTLLMRRRPVYPRRGRRAD